VTTLRELLADHFNDWPSDVQRIEAIVAARSALSDVLDDLIEEATHKARQNGTKWTDIGLALSSGSPSPPDDSPPPSAEPPARSGVRDHTGKYRDLWVWLVEQKVDEVTVTFSDVEQILGFKLPPSSREHLPHWHGYKGSAVARAIIDAGFRSRNVDLAGERLTLVRESR
jgi:hypothetical protein